MSRPTSSSPIVTGFNDEALTNANLRLSLHGKDPARRPPSPAASARRRSPPASPGANAARRRSRSSPADAGATLRFVDVYRRMYGGRLNAGIGLNDGPQAGVVQIRDFTLRNEPALSSIMAQGPEPAETDDGPRPPGRPGPGRPATSPSTGCGPTSSAPARRVDFSDAAISNAAMGFTLSGWLDTGRERTDMTAPSCRSTG